MSLDEMLERLKRSTDGRWRPSVENELVMIVIRQQEEMLRELHEISKKVGQGPRNERRND